MSFWKALSVLLEYPSENLYEALPEIGEHLGSGELDADERARVEPLLQWLAATPLLEAQARYVQTFDMVPTNSLHLTHHLFGDDKNRGPALIDLGEYYAGYGYQVSEGELPDFLPLMLEFVSTLELTEGRFFLSGWTKVLSQLAANLEAAASPYAGVLRLIEDQGRSVAGAALGYEPIAVPTEAGVGLEEDERGEEPPVTFGFAPHLDPRALMSNACATEACSPQPRHTA